MTTVSRTMTAAEREQERAARSFRDEVANLLAVLDPSDAGVLLRVRLVGLALRRFDTATSVVDQERGA